MAHMLNTSGKLTFIRKETKRFEFCFNGGIDDTLEYTSKTPAVSDAVQGNVGGE